MTEIQRFPVDVHAVFTHNHRRHSVQQLIELKLFLFPPLLRPLIDGSICTPGVHTCCTRVEDYNNHCLGLPRFDIEMKTFIVHSELGVTRWHICHGDYILGIT